MVSFSRLISAASDASLEEHLVTSSSTQLPRDCVLPTSVSIDTVPPVLRAALTAQSTQQSRDFQPASTVPLSLLLKDLGPEATSTHNMATLARALAHFGRPSEASVASALLFLTTTPPQDSSEDKQTIFNIFSLFCAHPDDPSQDPSMRQAVNSNPPPPSEWNTDVFVKAITTVAAQFDAPLDWRRIVLSLDVDGLSSRLTRASFIEIAKAYITGTNGSLLPADCLVGNWNHPLSQVTMLGYALSSQKLIDWTVLDGFEGATDEDLASPYSRVLLVEKLVELDAQHLLQEGIKEKGEVLLLSVACAKPRNNASIQQKLTVSLLTPLLNVFPSSEKTLRQMWNITPALVEAGIISMWKKDSSMLEKAFAISISLQILPELLSTATSLEFSLELAMLAYREDVLDLESWLSELLANRGLPVVSLCTLFLAQKVRSADMTAALQLPVDAVRIIFRCGLSALRNAGASQSQELMDGFRDVVEAYCRLNTRIRNLNPAADVGDRTVLVGAEMGVASSAVSVVESQNQGITQPSEGEMTPDSASTAAAMLYPTSSRADGRPVGFPDEIDKEADMFFQKLYRGEMVTDQAVDILRGLKASQSAHERQVFDCAMHTLFDEYRFFLKYPDRELRITGMLFGSVIHHGLISGTILSLAVGCVLDALRTVEPAPQPIGRYAKFGLCALERFRGRLFEWPQYCSFILNIPRLKEMAPELIAEVRKAQHYTPPSIPASESRHFNAFPSASEASNHPYSAMSEVPPRSDVDATENSSNVGPLMPSPPNSSRTTPVKPSISSTSLRVSPSVGADGALGLSALNLTTLLGLSPDEAEQVVAPDEATQDKIKFIFNNLSSATLDDKVEEMISILRPEYQRFLSVYIVVKRASTESNFHYLYLIMLDRIDPHLPSLYPIIYDTSYRRVRVLLSGDKIKTTSTERLVLKSLGSWIGSITIARNKPIHRRDLDLKELLMDAYSNGRLTTVVPFVSKVLEACSRSLVFKPTQPWIRSILGLMKEIYSVDDLKLNMKFELQLLCKTLKIDVNDITPSDLLKERPAPDKTNNPDFNTKNHAGSPPPQMSPSPTASPSPELTRPHFQAGGRANIPVFTLSDSQSASVSHSIPSALGQVPSSARVDMKGNLMPANLTMAGDVSGELSGLLAHSTISSNIASNAIHRNALPVPGSMGIGSASAVGATQRAVAGLNPTDMAFPVINQYVQISSSLVLFQTNPSLKRGVASAIDRAITEIIQPVVERSCAIAFFTTKELTLKDFANEPDMGKIRRAAHQMVQQLAGSLALVTSKEPLRVSIGNQLRIALAPAVNADQNLIDQTAQVLCAANLDLGCAIIERHAKEKSARNLAEKIGQLFANRRPQHSSYVLSIVPGPEVHRIYDEFSRVHSMNSVGQFDPTQPASSNIHPLHQVQIPNLGQAQTVPVQTQAPSRSMLILPEHRINGTVTDAAIDNRLLHSQLGGHNISPNRAMQISDVERSVEPLGNAIMAPHRVSPPPAPDVPPVNAVYGTALPAMACSTSVAAAILAAAGSYSSSSVSAPHTGSSAPNGGVNPDEEALSAQEVLERFNTVYSRITTLISENVSSSGTQLLLSDLPVENDLHSLWVQIPAAVKRSVTPDEAGMAVAQKVFIRLFEGESNLYREVHVMILDGIRESCRRLPKELSSWLSFSEDWKKLHKEVIIALMRVGSLLNITSYDEMLAKMIDNGRNSTALDFAGFLVHRAIIVEPIATAAELFATLETLAKIGRRLNPPSVPSCPEGLTKLVETARSVAHKPSTAGSPGPNVSLGGHESLHLNNRNARDGETVDPAGTRELIAGLLLEWHRILTSDSYAQPLADHPVTAFLKQIQAGMLDSEESRERFFRITVELVSTVTRAALQSRDGVPPIASDLVHAPYTVVEAAVRLIGCLCRFEGNSSAGVNDSGVKGIYILCQFLAALVKDVLKNVGNADLRPHFRLFSGLIAELAVRSKAEDSNNIEFSELRHSYFSNDATERLSSIVSKSEAVHFLSDHSSGYLSFVLQSDRKSSDDVGHEKPISLDNSQVVFALVGALSACSPALSPNFVFSWLQLISNKELMPHLLSLSTTFGWPMFRHLILKMVSFLSQFLTEPRRGISGGVRVLYGGLLRVLLVLLHDFPEFLCAHHMDFCDVIPPVCVQLRNLVLASFPRDKRLPDPLLPDLNVEDLPEMIQHPLILSDYMRHINNGGLRDILDNYLQGNGNNMMNLDELLKRSGTAGKREYATQRIYAIVLYMGQHAIGRNGEGGRLGGNASKFLRMLTRELDAEGRHHLLNGIANQLRYPNNNTMYYSSLVLVLFHEAQNDTIKEQITRVLVERLIANRPHPWGLLVTFVQLIKNSEYNFWGHSFVRCAPEIERLFQDVAKYCVGPSLVNNPQSLLAAS